MHGYDRTYKRVGTQNHRAESTPDAFCRLSLGRALALSRVRPDARAMRSTRSARPRAASDGMRGYDRTYKRVGTQNHRAESTLGAFLSFFTRPRYPRARE